MITFQPYDWRFTGEHIHIWGLDEQSNPLLVIIRDPPIFCFYELPNARWTESHVKIITNYINNKFSDNKPRSVQLVQLKKLYGYQDYNTNFLLINYPSTKSMRAITNYLRKVTFIPDIGNITFKPYEHESWISPITKFISLCKIHMCQWITIEAKSVEEENKISNIKEYIGDWRTIKGLDLNKASNPSVLAFDIESYSDDDRMFTNPLLAKHSVYMISVVYRFNNIYRKYLITTLAITPSDNYELIKAANEIDLIHQFEILINKLDPTIIIGYNIFGYDYQYLDTRLTRLNQQWLGCSRIINYQTTLHSSKVKNNTIYYLDMPGRVNLDLYLIIRKDFNLPRYNLNTVAMEILGRGKHDISAADMFNIYQRVTSNPTPDNIKDANRVALYCVEDSALLIDLYDKLNLWIGVVELSNIVGVTIFDLYTRGQQARCISQIYYKALGEYVINRQPAEKEQLDKYKGGFVMEPVTGLHEYVICLDFKSMYPSIIQAYNICYTTYVAENSNIPDDMCNVIEWSENNQRYRYRFIKSSIKRGILPQLVEQLVNDRNRVRSQQKSLLPNSVEYIILEKRQLALKISANAMYGFLGVKKDYSILPLIPGAMSITAMGRQLISKCRDYLVSNYNIIPIYGDTDSIMFQVPNVNNYNLTYEYGHKLEQAVNSILTKPLSTEFEKMGKILCIKKKHYAFWLADKNGLRTRTISMIKDPITGQLIKVSTNDPLAKQYQVIVDKQPDILFKGIMAARNDNCNWAKQVYKKLLYQVMSGSSCNQAFDYILQSVLDLMQHRVNKNDLAMYSEYNTNYKPDSNFFFKVFCDRLIKDGTSIEVGVKIGYLVVNNPASSKLADKLVLLESSSSANIDRLYYIKRLTKPINTLFSIVYSKDIIKLDKMYQENDQRKFIKYYNAYFVPEFPSKYNDFTDVIEAIKSNIGNNKSLKIFNQLRKYVFNSKGKMRITDNPIKTIIDLLEIKNSVNHELLDYIVLREANRNKS